MNSCNQDYESKNCTVNEDRYNVKVKSSTYHWSRGAGMIPFAVDENTFSLFRGVGGAHCLTSHPVRPFSDGLRPRTLEPLLASCHHTADVLVKKILNYLQGSGGEMVSLKTIV